jgi:hypothetical protein
MLIVIGARVPGSSLPRCRFDDLNDLVAHLLGLCCIGYPWRVRCIDLHSVDILCRDYPPIHERHPVWFDDGARHRWFASLESEEEATRALLEKCRARLVEITNEKFDLGLAEIVRLRREKEAAAEWDGLRPKLEKVLQ